MLFKLVVKYLKRKGFTVMKQAKDMTTVGFDTDGNKYVFYRK